MPLATDPESIVLFESADGTVSLSVHVDASGREVWLTRNQLAELYGRDVKTIGKHIGNALKEELAGCSGPVVAKFATTARDGKTYQIEHYSLDVAISVGYRVKSQRGIEFRRWANDVLNRYLVDGIARNEKRLAQLGAAVKVLRRLSGDIGVREVLDIVDGYMDALGILDAYDRQNIARPQGTENAYVLSYEECRQIIDQLPFARENNLFGREKDDSFRSSIAAIYQSFGGTELYPTIEEKAANLLYFVVKNHSFSDGNKRIAAVLFLYFLDRCGMLYAGNEAAISNELLAAMTLMVAESRPDEKESMVALVMNFLAWR